MKSKLYAGIVDHPEKNFTATVLIGEESYQVHLTRFPYSSDFFSVHFDRPCRLKHLQRVEFKNKNTAIIIIIPLLSKYNRRKLKKIAHLFHTDPSGESERKMMLKLLSIENLLDFLPLLDFLDIPESHARQILRQLAIKREIKIIRHLQLRSILYSNYLGLLEKFGKLLEEKFNSGHKTVPLREVEKKLEIRSRSLFFKYLFTKMQDRYSLRRTEDDLVFSQMVLSEEQKQTLASILACVKGELPLIFTLEGIMQKTEKPFKKINDALWYLVMDAEEVVRLDQQYFILKEEYQKLINKLKKYKRNQSEIITIQAFRDLTHLNRRTIIILFEAFDRKGITERIKNDRRILIEV